MTIADKLAALHDRGYGYDQLIRLGNLRGQYSLEGAVTALYEEFVAAARNRSSQELLGSTQEDSQDDFSCLPVESRNTDFDDVEDATL